MNKNPWDNYPNIWKTESAYMAFIRGGIRKALWNRYPIKTITIQKKRKRIPNPNLKGKIKEVWGGECYICHKDFPQKDLQVDHITGNHSLKSMDEVQSFIENMLFITEDDLALVCKPCHTIKSHAERKGITFEESRVEKRAIELCKLPTDKQVKILDKYSLPSNNTKVRREGFIKLLKENNNI